LIDFAMARRDGDRPDDRDVAGFSSDALYPVKIMPGWLQGLSNVNPLSHEVDALRRLLIGTPAHLGLDYLVLLAGCRRHLGSRAVDRSTRPLTTENARTSVIDLPGVRTVT
jgi:hypothetical protein